MKNISWNPIHDEIQDKLHNSCYADVHSPENSVMSNKVWVGLDVFDRINLGETFLITLKNIYDIRNS